MAKRRVVVTGLGMVTSLGLSVEKTWENVLAGQSGARHLDSPEYTDFPVQIAAPTVDFDPTEYLPPKEARKLSVFIQYALAAATQAMTDAKLSTEEQDPTRFGVAIGSGIGGLKEIVESQHALDAKGVRKLSPFFIPTAIINMAAGYVAIHHKLRGPNISIVSACTTGTHNIGYAARTIAYGDVDIMLAGGTEMATTPLGIAGFAALKALSRRNDEPSKASRPWDKDRDGFLLGDGAGVLVLEEYEHAKARGAKIYAELSGFGLSGDGYHMTAPFLDGIKECMSNALNDAGMAPEQVGYINAHATATSAGDVVEAQAIREVYGAAADKLCVSSTKSMLGHLLGAAGAVEAIFTILALRDQVVPPTINLDNPDNEFELDLVPHEKQARTLEVAVSNSFGFGGTNASLVFKRLS